MPLTNLKILIFAPFYPPHIGGLENYTQELCHHLAQKGIQITIFAPRLPTTALVGENPEPNLKIVRFPAVEIIHNYPFPKLWQPSFWKLFWPILQDNHSIIISKTRFFITSLFALILAKCCGKKLVHVEHGSDFVKLSSRFKNFIAKLYDYSFGKLVLRCSDTNVAISQAVQKFVFQFDHRECPVIYRGLDHQRIENIPPNTKLQQKFCSKTIITFIGRLIDGKGVADLIQALAGLKIQESDFVCFIIGDGPQSKKLQQLVEQLALQENVVFFGSLSFEDAMAILKISDIFVNPSYTEGLPTTVMEAATYKKAILATDVGGTNEIIEDAVSGLLFQPKDIAALQEKLAILIQQKDLRKNLGEAACQQSNQKFNWERCANDYIQIFHKLMAK